MSWDQLNYDSGNVRNLHYGIIHSSSKNIISSDALPFINNGFIPKKYTKIKNGDLILADTSEDRIDAAKGIEINLNDNFPLISGLHTIHLRENEKTTIDGYKAYYVASKSFKHFARKYCEGIKVFSIKPSLLKFTIFAYPHSTEEQEKIVKLLREVDAKKEFIERKIEILKKYKKGLAKTIMKDTIKEWLNKSEKGVELGSFLEERDEYYKNDGTYVHVTLSKEGISDKTDRYDRDFLVKDEDKKYKITRLNQLCYNPANLKFGVICINKYGTGIFSPIYLTYEIKNINIEYLELIVTSDDFRNYSMKYQQGTVYERMSVSPEDFSKIKIVTCEKDKQEVISKIVMSLNQNINLLETKLVLLVKLKSKLLNDMFI